MDKKSYKYWEQLRKDPNEEETNPTRFISFNQPLKCQWNNKEHSDWIYCGGNIIILLGALVNLVLVVAILVEHIRSKKNQ